MKRYKILITLLLVVLSFTALFVPLCSAAEIEYQYSLKQMVSAGTLDVTVLTGDSSSPTYTSVTANTSHWTEAIRFYPSSNSVNLQNWGLEIYSNNSSLLSDIGNASSVSVETGRFVWCTERFFPRDPSYPNPTSPGWAKMRMGLRLLLSDGTFKYFYSPWSLSNNYLSSEPSFGLPALEFPALSFSFTPPSNADSVYSLFFEVNINNNYGVASGSVAYFMMWGGKATFTLFTGSIAEAPIYEGPDTSGYDEYHASEDALLNDTADGRESVGSAIDDGFTALAPGGTLYNSMYFWRELMNDAINQIPMLSPMVTVSLSFGLVVFILGGSLVKVLTRDPDNKVSRKRGKGD